MGRKKKDIDAAFFAEFEDDGLNGGGDDAAPKQAGEDTSQGASKSIDKHREVYFNDVRGRIRTIARFARCAFSTVK